MKKDPFENQAIRSVRGPFLMGVKRGARVALSLGEEWFSLVLRKVGSGGLKMVSATLLVILVGCASVQTPMGGPRDDKPPKLLSAIPKNMSTNFKAEFIVLEFDEYFELQNEFKEISISPEMERLPLFKRKGKSLEIKFQDSLEKNTTYTLNFGNAIADVNERNVLKNFTYVFSTGAKLDSLSITGKVTNAFTALPEKEALVFLFPAGGADTLLGKKKPSIFSRTDTAGNYKLSNLRADQYKIYAVKDLNSDRIYQQGAELIGFPNTAVDLKTSTSGLNLKMFKEQPATFRILDRKIGQDGTIQIAFNRPLNDPAITVDRPAAADASKLYRFSSSGDSLKIWLPDMRFDTLKVSIKERDTLLESVTFGKNAKDLYTSALTATDNLEKGERVNPANPLKLNFPLPIKAVLKSGIVLMEDSISRTTFTTEIDSANFLSLNIRYPWKERSKYELRVNDGAVTALGDIKNKYFVRRFQRSSATDYGRMDMTVNVPKPVKNLIFELLNEDKQLIFSGPLKADTTFAFRNYNVGRYFVRVIFDQNGNGKWDTGNATKNMQPEVVWYDPRAFPIRANWELKYTVEVPGTPVN